MDLFGKYLKGAICAGMFMVCAFVANAQNAGANDKDEKPSSALVKKRLSFTLDEVIDLAREQSQPALVAKHTFTVKYWQFRSYKAQFLPSLNLDASLGQFNRSLRALQDAETGKTNYVENNSMSNSLNLSIDQNIPITGGTVSVITSLSRLDQFSPYDEITYNSQPVNVYYNQPITAFNTLKWEKKIAPKEFELAKKSYLETMESITIAATSYFFNLLSAQGAFDMAKRSYENNKTLYEISQERFKLGTIGKNELLQLELSVLNDELKLSNAELTLMMAMTRLRTYLGFNESVDIDLIIPSIPQGLLLDYNLVLNQSFANSTFGLSNQIDELNAKKNVAQAKANNGLKMSLYARFGLNQVGDDLPMAYKSPVDQEAFGLSVSLPIVDWGLGKGRVKVAKSQLEVTESQIIQEEQEHREEVMLQVLQFNLQ
ncbi:MAG: TolC family protein, partial [Bacteroidales bacterium]|nr:TolC family protein [Bacteroidales bacterium]